MFICLPGDTAVKSRDFSIIYNFSLYVIVILFIIYIIYIQSQRQLKNKKQYVHFTSVDTFFC